MDRSPFERALSRPEHIRGFQKFVLGLFRRQGRGFPFRYLADPYQVLVAEVMLQQTQAERVVPKFLDFITAWPSLELLAEAPLDSVLRLWQGLGYNRRARNLREAARLILRCFDGRIPADEVALCKLPGIGPATAGAVAVYAFNRPLVFIETNIRRVFLYTFVPGREGVTDNELWPLVERSLYLADPRTWYYALTDYGLMLRRVAKPNRRSAGYRKQSPFLESNRYIRGRILRALSRGGPIAADKLAAGIDRPYARLQSCLTALCREGLVAEDAGIYRLPSE